ncbi:MAG: polysaccharide biosynthesis/export family protein [Terracidiphilus sp.]
MRALFTVLFRRRRFVFAVVGGAALVCVVYCLLAPNIYEASARIALRASPVSTLDLNGASNANSAAFASGQTQLETLADVFRSDQLAWAVIARQHVYRSPAFLDRFGMQFRNMHPETPSPEAQEYLLERFQECLLVRTLPRTLILQIRFRSRDPALSAVVVNDLIRTYVEREADARVQATTEASGLLREQLSILKARVDKDDAHLIAFQQKHGLLDTPEMLANGQPSAALHTAALAAVDDLNRELVAATAERIQREAEYRAALRGNPELVVASDPHLQAQNGAFATALLLQLHARHSDLELEASQLSTEHGPSFPRVVEIYAQLKDLDRQIAAQNTRLVSQFKQTWETAAEREKLLRQNLDQTTSLGMKLNAAETELAAMRQEANASHELYTRTLERTEEAGLAAAMRTSQIEVVDAARQPVKPIAPDLPVYLAVTLFISLWLAVGGALLLESLHPSSICVPILLLAALVASTSSLHAQAPTPSTSGLPTGVARIPQSTEPRSQPNAKDAPTTWGSATPPASLSSQALASATSPIAAPLGPGDLLEVSEFHTPEFRSTVRVSETGAVTLPLIGDVQVAGSTPHAAAQAIERALVEKGMLLHPQVSVLVTAYAALDVSVLGEVARPGVYPYAVHHRLLDLLSAASGLGPNAGSLVTVVHRDDKSPPLAVDLHENGDAVAGTNPELEPGDTVQVSRAGLVYVIGDVIRPGGFPIDPAQHLTVVQALTLAWGPTQNAALAKAILIREQKGGRTLTALNLKRLLRGQDPDLTIQDRDILFVPDSVAKNLWNRTMESVVQSAVGVSIYAGLVYSQRF